jgi:hypothetical protein
VTPIRIAEKTTYPQQYRRMAREADQGTTVIELAPGGGEAVGAGSLPAPRVYDGSMFTAVLTWEVKHVQPRHKWR